MCCYMYIDIYKIVYIYIYTHYINNHQILEAYTKEEASSHKKSNIAKLAPLSLPPQPTFRAS